MQRTAAYYLTGLLAAFATHAQTSLQPGISVRISSSNNACFVADVQVPCEKVGQKLRAMKVAKGAYIHISGDEHVSYMQTRTVVESVSKEGYTVGVAFLTD